MIEATELWNVRQTIYANSMLVVHKIREIITEHLMKDISLMADLHTYDTRSRSNFYQSSVKTATGRNSLFLRVSIQYNELLEIVGAANV